MEAAPSFIAEEESYTPTASLLLSLVVAADNEKISDKKPRKRIRQHVFFLLIKTKIGRGGRGGPRENGIASRGDEKANSR